MNYPNPHSGSEIYTTKSITWEIRRQSSWIYSSPPLDLNKINECSLAVNLASNGYQHQYNINSINLKFTDSYHPDYNSRCILVILHLPSTVHLCQLLPDKSGNNFTSNNVSTIIESALGSSTCKITAKIFYPKLDCIYDHNISSFLNDMKDMLKTGIHSDFEIKAGDNTFKVHKAVIASRSKVLKNMSENNMLEKKTNKLELQADPIVVEPLLSYIYTNHCKVTAAPTELFKLAHFLELEELQNTCKKYLLENINLKNIISILELTSYNDYGLEDLHKKAMMFVTTNEDSLVLDLEFQQFLSDNIKLETITYILRISYEHELDNCLEKAIEFVRKNYKIVLDNSEFQDYMKHQTALSLKILHHCLDYFNSDSNKKD